MRMIGSALALTLMLALAGGPMARAEGGTVNIPDAVLQKCVNGRLGQPATSSVTTAQAESITVLSCGAPNDLTGLEALTALRDLSFYNVNSPTFSIPASLKDLQVLAIYGGEVTVVNLPSTLAKLETLTVTRTYLGGLRLPTGLTSLKTLLLNENRILAVADVTGVPALTDVWMYGQTPAPFPDWPQRTPYPFPSTDRTGQPLQTTNVLAVVDGKSITYQEPGDYAYILGARTGRFSLKITQRVTDPKAPQFTPTPFPLEYHLRPFGDHTGDGVSDTYGIDAGQRLLMYPGTTVGRFQNPTVVGTNMGDLTTLTQTPRARQGDGALIARRAVDDGLYSYETSMGGYIVRTTKIGTKWGGMDLIVATSLHVYARQASTGDLFLFDYNPNAEDLTNRGRVGRGWSAIKQIVAIDVTGEGDADLVAIRKDGTLLTYRVAPDGTIGGARVTGRGWNTFRQAWVPGNVTTLMQYTTARDDLMGQSLTGNVYVYENRLGSWGYPRLAMTRAAGLRLMA